MMDESSTLNHAMRIRTRVMAVYNLREEDFETADQWNDYLEEREDVAFSLVEGVDAARAEARLQAYTRDNADSIAKYQAQRAEEEAGDEARRMSYRMASQGGREQPGGGRGMPRSYAEEMAEQGGASPEQEKQWQMLSALAGGWRPEVAQQRSLQEARVSLFA